MTSIIILALRLAVKDDRKDKKKQQRHNNNDEDEEAEEHDSYNENDSSSNSSDDDDEVHHFDFTSLYAGFVALSSIFCAVAPRLCKEVYALKSQVELMRRAPSFHLAQVIALEDVLIDDDYVVNLLSGLMCPRKIELQDCAVTENLISKLDPFFGTLEEIIVTDVVAGVGLHIPEPTTVHSIISQLLSHKVEVVRRNAAMSLHQIIEVQRDRDNYDFPTELAAPSAGGGGVVPDAITLMLTHCIDDKKVSADTWAAGLDGISEIVEHGIIKKEQTAAICQRLLWLLDTNEPLVIHHATWLLCMLFNADSGHGGSVVKPAFDSDVMLAALELFKTMIGPEDGSAVRHLLLQVRDHGADERVSRQLKTLENLIDAFDSIIRSHIKDPKPPGQRSGDSDDDDENEDDDDEDDPCQIHSISEYQRFVDRGLFRALHIFLSLTASEKGCVLVEQINSALIRKLIGEAWILLGCAVEHLSRAMLDAGLIDIAIDYLDRRLNNTDMKEMAKKNIAQQQQEQQQQLFPFSQPKMSPLAEFDSDYIDEDFVNVSYVLFGYSSAYDKVTDVVDTTKDDGLMPLLELFVYQSCRGVFRFLRPYMTWATKMTCAPRAIDDDDDDDGDCYDGDKTKNSIWYDDRRNLLVNALHLLLFVSNQTRDLPKLAFAEVKKLRRWSNNLLFSSEPNATQNLFDHVMGCGGGGDEWQSDDEEEQQEEERSTTAATATEPAIASSSIGATVKTKTAARNFLALFLLNDAIVSDLEFAQDNFDDGEDYEDDSEGSLTSTIAELLDVRSWLFPKPKPKPKVKSSKKKRGVKR